ncbi:TetR/AcrR family transcriptional regulator [bacterium]|nr:TetR/AcrR family transcriptional regulator [bacterium]
MLSDRSYSESEEKIFLAAIDVFSKRGKQGARLQEIADQAGLNKALIHYYFRNKERLYDEVFVFVIRHFFLRLASTIPENASFDEMLKHFIDRYMDLLSEKPALPLFILRDIADGEPLLGAKMREIFLPEGKNVPQVFIRGFERAVRQGEIRDLGAAQTLITVMGSCIYIFAAFPVISAVLPEIAEQRTAFLEERKRHIYDILMNGLKPRTELHS